MPGGLWSGWQMFGCRCLKREHEAKAGKTVAVKAEPGTRLQSDANKKVKTGPSFVWNVTAKATFVQEPESM